MTQLNTPNVYIHTHARPVKAFANGIQCFLSIYWAAVELLKNLFGAFLVLTTLAKVPPFRT